MLNCESVDITVEPQELSAIIVPGGLKVFVVLIKKGRSLMQTDVTFALERFKLGVVPTARAPVDPSREQRVAGRVSLEQVNIDVERAASPAGPGHVQEEECVPFVRNSKTNQTYYYFTPRKEPPAALPRVQFFW